MPLALARLYLTVLMMTLRRNVRRAEASEIAADYLLRFPTGTYAHAARPLLPAR